MAVVAGARPRGWRSRRSLPVLVGLPFVAMAVSAGCWYPAPSTSTGLPVVRVLAVDAAAPQPGSVGWQAAPAGAAGVEAATGPDRSTAGTPARAYSRLGNAPELLPETLRGTVRVAPGRVYRSTTGERAPPQRIG